MTAPRYAEVAVPLPVQGTFTYEIPREIRDEVERGHRVEVPWGPRLITGFVLDLGDETEMDLRRIKRISSILDEDRPALIPEIIDLCRWASSYYLAPIGEMLRAALPANMSARGRREVGVTVDPEEIERIVALHGLGETDRDVLSRIGSSTLDAQRLVREVPEARGALKRLREAGVIEIRESVIDAEGVRFERWLTRTAIEPRASNEKQQTAIDLLLKAGGEISWSQLVDQGASSSSISTLVRKGAFAVERRPVERSLDSFVLDGRVVGELTLSPAQTEAVDSVNARLGSFSPFLLQGVTGSGKTEVYIEIAREVVRRGQQALILVPEIGLTPSLAARLRERFGERVAILHSSLATGDRWMQWQKARRGEVSVAVGPRSALFTPFDNLGVIIIDEEGDGAYKQEETPRYNARDLAVVRGRLSTCPVVLGSATPSLESRYNVETEKYTLLRLASRIGERGLPETEIVDLRGERGEKEDRGMVIFTSRLREEIGRVISEDRQVIILINRRGYAPYLLCRECENDFHCRDCSVTMTVHRREGQLICHYCGYRVPIPTVCTACGGEVLQPIGFGTEKVEERFRRDFPGVSAEVLDRDTVRRRGALVGVLDRFRRRKTQVLIGTQMVSKGHDFPEVTLTAVLNADSILGYPDFRSGEKTFYLLTQVSGRAGRGESPGRVIIQTAFPDHYAIHFAISQDYEAFYQAEIDFRRRFHYPPVATMIAILLRGDDEGRVQRSSEELGRRVERSVSGIDDARVQGPAPAPLARIKGSYRYQILVRSTRRAALRNAVDAAVTGYQPKGVDVTIDVDPLNLL
jgi:primosomal protein N' (replication factor Y) (superfamily II helicase)